jgi:hypothetical protein
MSEEIKDQEVTPEVPAEATPETPAQELEPEEGVAVA